MTVNEWKCELLKITENEVVKNEAMEEARIFWGLFISSQRLADNTDC